MRAPISVVIPTLNAEASLPKCLQGLMEGVDAGLIRELIVSDGGSVDGTCATAQAWGAEILEGPASRGAQLALGCAAAKGEWVLVVHADTILQPGWSAAASAHLSHPQQAAWFKLSFDQGGMAAAIVAGWANLRSRFGLPYGDQGLLVHSSLYDEVGGYADVPLMEDVKIARALRGRMTGLDAVAQTSAAKYLAQGWLRRGLRNLWTLARYYCGTGIETLATSYRR